MAFTEAALVAQLDPTGTGRTIIIQSLVFGPVVTDVYAIGKVAPYAGHSRWIQVASSSTAAQAATLVINGLTQHR